MTNTLQIKRPLTRHSAILTMMLAFCPFTALSQETILKDANLSKIDFDVAIAGCTLVIGNSSSCSVAGSSGFKPELIQLDDFKQNSVKTDEQNSRYQVFYDQAVTDVTTYNNYDGRARARFLASTFFDADAAVETEIKTGIKLDNTVDILKSTKVIDWFSSIPDFDLTPSIFLTSSNDTTTIIDLNAITYATLLARDEMSKDASASVGWTVDRAEWLKNSEDIESKIKIILKELGNESFKTIELVNWDASQVPIELRSSLD